MDRQTFYRTLTEFIASIGPDDEVLAAGLGPDENLFDAGYLTSFSVVEVLMFLESTTGKSIDPALFDIESFSSLRRLYAVVERDLQDLPLSA